MPARVRRSIAALVLGALVGPLPTSVTASVQASTARTWVPPAYLMWRAGGLPSGLTPKLDALQGTEAVVVVAGDTLWMKRSVRSGGGVVDRAGGRYRFPIEVMAAKAKDMSPFLPGPWRDAVLDAWKAGRGVLGATSAAIRRLDVGDRMIFPGGRLTIGAIVPDEVVAWSEVMVARATGHRDVAVVLRIDVREPDVVPGVGLGLGDLLGVVEREEPDVARVVHLTCAHRTADEVACGIQRGEHREVDVLDELLDAGDGFDAGDFGGLCRVGHASTLPEQSIWRQGIDRSDAATGFTSGRNGPAPR